MTVDLAIVGTGSAGYTASVYASRYKINHIIIGELAGGVITESPLVENFPTEESITGMELGLKMQKHVKDLGIKEILSKVNKLSKKDNQFILTLDNGDPITAKAVLLATGTINRKLGVPGEKELSGKGVAYCATCDGFFFKDKVLAIVGGSDSANTSGVYLSNIAKQVYIIARGKELKGEIAWIDQLETASNVEIILNTNVVEILGNDKVERLKLDKEYKGSNFLSVDGIFIEIGATPATNLAKRLGAEVNEKGYLKVKQDQSTTIDGLFAAGDLTTNSNGFKQVVTACAEGAIATEAIFKYLKR